MSFLNSVLSSIGSGGDDKPISATVPRVSTSHHPPKILESSKDVTTETRSQKRKAAEDISDPSTKISRRDNPATLSSAQQTQNAAQRTQDKNVQPRTKLDIPPTGVNIRQLSETKSSHPSPSGPASPKAPPKKGSYAEILARAKAAQAARTHVGVIKHKPKEKPLALSKKEREKLAANAAKIQKEKGLGARHAIGAGKDTRPIKGSALSKDRSTTPPRRKPVELAYKGTMRPASQEPPAYGGTMSKTAGANGIEHRGNSKGTSGGKKSSYSAGPRYRYASYSDEEDEEDDYVSDASSAMEAAAFEIDEEELESTKVARREDDEALREEMKLKRNKLEKKRKLEAISAKRR